jgi:lactoylglutathione lyase
VPGVRQLSYAIVYVSDLEASVAFYRDLIGLRLKFIDAGFAEFDTGEARFALYEKRRAGWLTGEVVSPGPAAEVAFLVDDLEEEMRRLTELGATVLSGPADRPWGHRTLHVADPDGFVVEFAQSPIHKEDHSQRGAWSPAPVVTSSPARPGQTCRAASRVHGPVIG